MAQMVKRLPAMHETWVQSLGWEDPLEKEMATHPSTLSQKIPTSQDIKGSAGIDDGRHAHKKLNC